MTIFNMQKCILHYYTSVKVGTYSIASTPRKSVETLAFALRFPAFERFTLYAFASVDFTQCFLRAFHASFLLQSRK